MKQAVTYYFNRRAIRNTRSYCKKINLESLIGILHVICCATLLGMEFIKNLNIEMCIMLE